MTNSKRKGNSWERAVVKILNDNFKSYFNEGFTRNIDSGSFFGGKNKNIESRKIMSDMYKVMHAGDVVTPVDFPFTIECKSYSVENAPNMYTILQNDSSVLDEWLKQAKSDAKFVKKKYMIVLNITRKANYVVVDYADFVSKCIKSLEDLPEKFIMYKDSVIIDKELFINRYIESYFPKEKKSQKSND